MSRGRESWGRGVDGEVAADSGRIQTQSAEEKMLDERLLLEDLEHQYLVGKVGKGADPGSTRSRRERKIQVLFTAAMTISGAMMMVGMTYETRWISHRLGPVQMGAYSIAHSAKNYVENVRALWGGSTAKIGRAIGAKDDDEVSRLIKMTIMASFVCITLQAGFYWPASPWLLKDVYSCNTTAGAVQGYDEPRSVYSFALPYLQIRAIGESGTRFLEEAAASIIQGLQFLVPYSILQFFHSGFSWFATWWVVEYNGWDIDMDAWSRVVREAVAFLWCYSVIFYILRVRRDTKGRYTLLSSELTREDWKHFIGDGVFMLITAYSYMVVDTLTGILTARLSTDEASANQILGRVQSFPYVFSGAFGAAINTLGSRYLGETDDKRYLNLGFALIGVSLLIGGTCAIAIFAGAAEIFGIYTSDPATLALLKPTRLIVIPYVICSLCNSVTDGMVVAAQEFKLQSAVYISALVCAYLPFILVVCEYPLDRVSGLSDSCDLTCDISVLLPRADCASRACAQITTTTSRST